MSVTFVYLDLTGNTFDELQRSLIRNSAKRACHQFGWLVSPLSVQFATVRAGFAVDALRGARSTPTPICGASDDLPDRPQQLSKLKVGNPLRCAGRWVW